MEFLKGALIAGLWGSLVSVLLALLVVVATISLFNSGWDGGAFVRGMLFMPSMIGLVVVPLVVLVCLWWGLSLRLLGELRLRSGIISEYPERVVRWTPFHAPIG